MPSDLTKTRGRRERALDTGNMLFLDEAPQCAVSLMPPIAVCFLELLSKNQCLKLTTLPTNIRKGGRHRYCDAAAALLHDDDEHESQVVLNALLS